jgi:hypothetical protein
MTSLVQDWSFSGAPTQSTSRAPSTSKRRGARVPIARVEHFMLGAASPAERVKLVDDTYRISRAYFPDETHEEFERTFFSADETWVFLFFGPDEELAGFAAVSNVWVNHEDEDVACFKGMACIDSRYKLTWRSRLPVVREAVKFKLRHPWTRAGYMGMAATPSGYRLVTSSVPRVYPSREDGMPDSVKALILKAMKVRGLEVVDEERLLVRAASRLAQPERIRESRGLSADPDARYFMERNPDYEEHYMMVWAPLGFRDLARGAANMLRKHLVGDGARA